MFFSLLTLSTYLVPVLGLFFIAWADRACSDSYNFLPSGQRKNLFLPVLGLILGISLAYNFEILWRPLFLVLGLLIIFLFLKQKLSLFSYFLAYLFLGCFTFKLNQYYFDLALHRLSTANKIVGFVENVELRQGPANKVKLTLKLSEIQGRPLFLPSIYVNLFLPFDKFKPGDKLLIKNFQASRLESFGLKDNISGSIFVRNFSDVIKLRSIGGFFSGKLFLLRFKLKKCLEDKLLSSSSRLFNNIFLGFKNFDCASLEIRQHFNLWGISHYLARSGLHLSTLAFLWFLLFSLLPFFALGSLFSSVATIVILLYFQLYALLSWMSISFFRSLLILNLVILARFFNRKANLSRVLSVVALWTLLCYPFALLALDFQLSFGLVFALLSVPL